MLSLISLIPIVEANDITVSRTPSQILGRFAANPVGEGPALDALKAGMCAQFSWQFSALIRGTLPAAIAELVVFKVGPHAGALGILAALYAPHLQPAAIARQNDKVYIKIGTLWNVVGYRSPWGLGISFILSLSGGLQRPNA